MKGILQKQLRWVNAKLEDFELLPKEERFDNDWYKGYKRAIENLINQHEEHIKVQNSTGVSQDTSL